MKRATILLLASITAAGLVSAALAGPPASLPGAKASHRVKASVIRADKMETLTDGTIRTNSVRRLDIPGMQPRDLESTVDNAPMAKGGRQTVTIVDAEHGETSIFAYDPGTNAITIQAGGADVTIVQNPDHSYSVDGTAAADGAAAVAVLAGKSAWTNASPQAVGLAYLYARYPLASKKLPPYGDVWMSNATPPSCAPCSKTSARRHSARRRRTASPGQPRLLAGAPPRSVSRYR